MSELEAAVEAVLRLSASTSSKFAMLSASTSTYDDDDLAVDGAVRTSSLSIVGASGLGASWIQWYGILQQRPQ